MRRVNATDFKTHFVEFIDLVREGPIEVQRGGEKVGRDEAMRLLKERLKREK